MGSWGGRSSGRKTPGTVERKATVGQEGICGCEESLARPGLEKKEVAVRMSVFGQGTRGDGFLQKKKARPEAEHYRLTEPLRVWLELKDVLSFPEILAAPFRGFLSSS